MPRTPARRALIGSLAEVHLLSRATFVASLAVLVGGLATGCTPPPVAGSGLPCNDDGDCPRAEACVEGACSPGGEPHDPPATDAGGGPDVDGGPRDAGFDAGPAAPDDGGPATDDGGVVDSGQLVDAGAAPDGGHADDAGQAADAGAPLDAGALDPPWWDVGFGARARLRLLAEDSDLTKAQLVRLVIDHAALVSNNLSQDDGADLRVVCRVGASWIPVPFRIPQGAEPNTATTPLLVRLEAAIAQGSIDDSYWLYFDSPTAPPGPTTDIPAGRVLMAEQTDAAVSPSSGAVEALALEVEPALPGDAFVVVATWRQRSTSVATGFSRSGFMDVLVNGEPVTGAQQITFKQGHQHAKALSAMLVVRASEGPKRVSLSYGPDSLGGDIADEARIVAFHVDELAADLRVSNAPALSLLPGPGSGAIADVVANEIAFTPYSAGDYLWIATGYLREGPGTCCKTHLYGANEAGAVTNYAEESFIESGELGYVPLFSLDVRPLPAAPVTLQVRHFHENTSGSASRRGVSQAALRTDAFDLRVEDASPTIISTSDLTALSMTLPPATSPREWIVLGSMSYENNVGDILLISETLWALDSVKRGGDTLAMSRSLETQAPYVDTIVTERAVTLTTTVFPASGQEVDMSVARAFALRYADPATSLDPVERR